MPIERDTLLQWCEQELNLSAFKDYAPNGLQVQGKEHIGHIVGAVTASLAAIEFAVAQKADMLLVHHGFFWKSEPVPIVGWKHRRIATLIQNNINMAAYHLPLDAHPEIGNNATLAQRMGWQIDGQMGEQNLLMYGRAATGTTGHSLCADLHEKLQREPVWAGDLAKPIKTLMWCTGGAQSWLQVACDKGVDAYITGEISEAQYHLAQETGVVFISAGHHATERYGVQALGSRLADEFGLSFVFFDEQNPA